MVGTYALAWFLLNVFRASLPVLLPKLRELYDVGFTDAGVIFAMLFAGLALVQFPSGLLADAIGDRWVVISSLRASSAVLSVFGLATMVPVLLLLAFLFGIAAGGFRSVAISAVTKVAGSDGRSSALGLMAAGNLLGNLLGPILTAVGIVAFGVASVPLVLGVAGFAVAACLGLVLSTVGDDIAAAGVPMGTDSTAEFWPEVRRRGSLLVDVVTSRVGGLIILLSFAFSMIWQGMFTFPADVPRRGPSAAARRDRCGHWCYVRRRHPRERHSWPGRRQGRRGRRPAGRLPDRRGLSSYAPDGRRPDTCGRRARRAGAESRSDNPGPRHVHQSTGPTG